MGILNVPVIAEDLSEWTLIDQIQIQISFTAYSKTLSLRNLPVTNAANKNKIPNKYILLGHVFQNDHTQATTDFREEAGAERFYLKCPPLVPFL